jgi:hypothetical protein
MCLVEAAATVNDDARPAEELLAAARARADRAAARSIELYGRPERMQAGRLDLPDGTPVRPAPAQRIRTVPLDRRVAPVEEMAAAAHQQAAELYESWLERQTGPPPAPPERAQQHRHAGISRSVEWLAERALTGFETRLETGATTAGRINSLAVLAALDRLRVMVSRRVDETVEACRREGATREEIGSALHVTRQTAHERYRRRAE